MGQIGRPPIQRFAAKVALSQGCWLWTGALNPRGYPLLNVGGRSTLAHRYAYETFGGVIPDGWTLDHVCEMKACVNPNHLDPAPALVNHARANRQLFGIGQSRKTRCPQGHPYDEANTYRHRGERHCRTCAREANRRWTARKGK